VNCLSRRIDLLRLDYIFSVIVPILIAIFINNYLIWDHIDIIVGFAMLAITGNTWNDVVDMRDPNEKETLERVKGYHWKEIFTIGLVSFVLGITLLLRTCFEKWINGVLLVVIIVLVLLYCTRYKSIPILNHILLGGSHILLPYFMIKIDHIGIPLTEPLMTDMEWFLMITFFTYAITGQFVHEVIDGDSITRFSLKTQQKIIWISSVVTLIVAICTLILYPVIYFFPFIFFPIGTMYTFRHPTSSTKGVKDVGILMGNFLLVYFITLIIMQMNGLVIIP
jgi:4-hydroxybenzoate polyprenyltransferase